MAPLRVALLGAAVAGALGDEWENWKWQFGKVYNGGEEDEIRKQIFEDNVAFINGENTKGYSYTLALNMFSDLTTEEFSSTYMGYKAPEEAFEDVPYLGVHVPSEEAAGSVDWSTNSNVVTPVKNQKSCGSCWAFSSTGALEGATSIYKGRTVSLSEQQLVDCAKTAGNGCQGGDMGRAFAWAQQNALCLESAYTYKGTDGQCQSSGCAVGVNKGDVTGYKSVNHWIYSAKEGDMMSAVHQQPVSVAIEADRRAFQSYKGGVLAANAGCGTQLDHGVLAVGYGAGAGKQYWKIKNSWGSGWGEHGYIRVERGNGGAGTCGILKQPVYPVMASSVVV